MTFGTVLTNSEYSVSLLLITPLFSSVGFAADFRNKEAVFKSLDVARGITVMSTFSYFVGFKLQL